MCSTEVGFSNIPGVDESSTTSADEGLGEFCDPDDSETGSRDDFFEASVVYACRVVSFLRGSTTTSSFTASDLMCDGVGEGDLGGLIFMGSSGVTSGVGLGLIAGNSGGGAGRDGLGGGTLDDVAVAADTADTITDDDC